MSQFDKGTLSLPVFVCVCAYGHFTSTGDIYDDFHLQTGVIRAMLPVCKMLYFVACVGLPGSVWWALEFLGRIGLRLGLGLWSVFGCMSPFDMICKYSMCVCMCFEKS